MSTASSLPASAQALPPMEAELTRDEGYITVPRKDTLGNWFCGVGCDLRAHGMLQTNGLPKSMAPWTNQGIVDQLDKDMADAAFHLHMGAPWTQQLDVVRYRVLWNMCFNMGWLSKDGKHGLGTFTETCALIRAGHYPEAAAHMLASAWAREVKQRAPRLAARMATGDYSAPWAPGQVIASSQASNHTPPPATPDAQEQPDIGSRILSFLRRKL